MGNLEGKVARLERARGSRRGVINPREMTRAEIIDALIDLGSPIRHDMSTEEIASIAKRELEEIQRGDRPGRNRHTESTDHVS